MNNEVPYKDKLLSLTNNFKPFISNLQPDVNYDNFELDMFSRTYLYSLYDQIENKSANGLSLHNELDRLVPNTYNIYLLGAGGVASWLLPQLLKLLYNYLKKSSVKHIFNVKIVDGDTVELKNILRQNFIPTDVGENKAKVLSLRYNNIYENINVSYIDKYIYSSAFLSEMRIDSVQTSEITPDRYIELSEVFSMSNKTLFIFNMMDNEFSKHMLDYYLSKTFMFLGTRYFCTGCDINHGLVFTSLLKIQPYYTHYFKDFTFIEEDAQIETHSCAEVAEVATIEQTFDSNAMAANLLSTLVSNCLSNPFVSTQRINFTSTDKPYVSSIETHYIDYHILNKVYNYYRDKIISYDSRYGLDGNTRTARKYKEMFDFFSKYFQFNI